MTASNTALPRPRSRLAPLYGGLRVAAALLWLVLLLGVPSAPDRWQVYGLASVPVELAVLVAALVLVPPLRRSRALAAALGGLGLLVAVIKLADVATQVSFGRPVSLYVDRLLLVNGMHLANGVLGAFGLIGITLGVVVAGWCVWWATSRSVRVLQQALSVSPSGRGIAGGLAALVILGFAIGQAVPDAYGPARPVNDNASFMVADQVRRLIPALAMQGRFRAEEAVDPLVGGVSRTPWPGWAAPTSPSSSSNPTAAARWRIRASTPCPRRRWPRWGRSWLPPGSTPPPAGWPRRPAAASPGWRMRRWPAACRSTTRCATTCWSPAGA